MPDLPSLDLDTGMYVDLHICLRLLGMRYPDYIAQTSPVERYLYRLFLALERAKDAHQVERRARHRDAERAAQEQVPGLRGRH